MRRLILLALLVFFAQTTFGQNKPYHFVEKMPRFSGTSKSAGDYFIEKMRYTPTTRQDNVKGHVSMNMLILKDGSVASVDINRSPSPVLDSILRDIGLSMPKWTPGYQDESPVDVFATVSFYLKYENWMPIDTAIERHFESKRNENELARKAEIDRLERERFRYDSTILAAQVANEKDFRAQCVKEFGQKIGNKLADQKIEIGMSKRMCELAWGTPTKTNTTATKNGLIETWWYGYEREVIFKDGKVVSITK